MYIVVKYFTDLHDNNHVYKVGDTFPHDGREVEDARLEELLTDKNKRGVPLIALKEFASAPRIDSTDKVEEIPVKEEKPEIKADTEAESKPKKATRRKAK